MAVAASLSLTVLCISCGGKRPTSVAVADGHVLTTDSVSLYFRALGAGSDTVVVLHGGPGFSSAAILPDLEPLAAHHVVIS